MFYDPFVLQYYGCQVIIHPSLYVTPFQFEFLPKSYGIPFQFGLTLPQQFVVLVCELSNK